MNCFDLKCEDHQKRFNENIKATRYCAICKMTCCDTCVIDFHIDHIILAKTRIDEYLLNVKSKLDNIREMINNSINSKINIQEIYKIELIKHLLKKLTFSVSLSNFFK